MNKKSVARMSLINYTFPNNLSCLFVGHTALKENAIQITSFGKSDPGLKRSTNEDSILIIEEAGLFLVADGMGGQASGDIASKLFASTISSLFNPVHRPANENLATFIKSCFDEANRQIRKQAKKNPQQKGMGCTADLMRITDKTFVLGHVGDSRTYLLRDSNLKLLTKDHSFIQQQIDLGIVSTEQAREHPMRNIILNAVGTDENLTVDIVEGNIHAGDLFMLCTDGLSSPLEESIIRNILSSEENLELKASLLVSLGKGACGDDNLSVILVEIE